jgi:hypothetical protein
LPQIFMDNISFKNYFKTTNRFNIKSWQETSAKIYNLADSDDKEMIDAKECFQNLYYTCIAWQICLDWPSKKTLSNVGINDA